MKKILGLALAGALSVAALPAVAADYPLKAPPPPIWTWTGFYIGIVAGAGWDHTDFTATSGVTSGDFQGSGGVIGGTLGWNWQAPGSPWVIGVEGDWSWSNLRANTAGVGGCGAAPGGGCIATVDWLATIRARLGHANGPLLFYITGGAAFADIHNFQPSIVGADTRSTESGWTVGAGLEGMLSPNWSLKAEYLYADFGQSGFCSVAACGVLVVANYTRIHILRAGVNYKF